MKCPRCSSQLKEIDYEGVRIDSCESCGGEWVDHDEVYHIHTVEEVVFSDDEKVYVKGIKESLPVKVEQPADPLNCPQCNKEMMINNYAYSSGILVEKCPDNHGVWLDHTELEHLQMFVESHRAEREGRLKTFKPVLEKIAADSEARHKEVADRVAQSSLIARVMPAPIDNFVAAVIYGLFD